MKKLTVLVAAILVVLTLLSLFGCAPKQELRKVVLNEVTRSVFYAPLYVAVSKGFFEAEGMEIEIVTGGGSDKSMTALISNQADVALMGPETAVYVVNQGKEEHPVVVAQLTKRDGSFLVGRQNEADFDWAKLKGKSIIGGRRGGMPFMTLEYVLKKHGLNPGVDVTVYDNVQFNLMGGAFEGGQGDYVTLFEPTATLFQQQGKGFIVSNVGLESGEVPYTTFMVNQSTVKNDPKFVQAFVRALYKAQKFVQTASDEEIATAMLPFFPDSDEATLKIVANSYRSTDSWCLDPVMTEDSFARLLDIIDSAGELSARPQLSEVVDNSFAIAALEAEK